MVTNRVRNLLGFLRDNVEQNRETIRDARRFVRQIEDHLSEPERLLLGCALRSQAQMRQFASALKTDDATANQ